MSLLVEKLIFEIKRIKKENPNVNLRLDDDVGLIFFTELYDKQNVSVSSDFDHSLKDYTRSAVSKLQGMGGQWTTDHELMLNTVLEERFAMANLVRQANIEIEKVRAISDQRAAALREKENQYAQASKALAESKDALANLLANNPSLHDNVVINRVYTNISGYVDGTSYKLDEPLRIVGEVVGSGDNWARIQSNLRERDEEILRLKGRIIDIEKSNIRTEYSGVDHERTLNTMRGENANLVKEIDRLRSQASLSSSSAKEKELEIKLRTANSRVQELESEIRTVQLRANEAKDSRTSAASSSLVDRSQSGMVSSEYSSASSTSQRQGYDAPSYGASSSYTETSKVSTTEVGKGSSYVQQTTSNVYGASSYGQQSSTSSYGASGTSGVSASSSSAFGQSSTSAYGQSSSPSAAYQAPAKASGVTSTLAGSGVGATGSSSGVRSSNTYGASQSSATYGSSATSGANYGATLPSATSGVTGSSTSGTAGSSFAFSSGSKGGYQFQTKKY